MVFVIIWVYIYYIVPSMDFSIRNLKCWVLDPLEKALRFMEPHALGIVGASVVTSIICQLFLGQLEYHIPQMHLKLIPGNCLGFNIVRSTLVLGSSLVCVAGSSRGGCNKRERERERERSRESEREGEIERERERETEIEREIERERERERARESERERERARESERERERASERERERLTREREREREREGETERETSGWFSGLWLTPKAAFRFG